MPWNWQLPDWPAFQYNPEKITSLEKEFLMGAGSSFAYLKDLKRADFQGFIVEILSTEGVDSSKIEGELLDRESLQSSIRRQFGFDGKEKKQTDKETRVAKLLLDVYETFERPLTHEMLWKWHSVLFGKNSPLANHGEYRSHPEPMQIVSNRYGPATVYFEAPPSKSVPQEMDSFINWFNHTSQSLPILGRASLAHVYFESIHPFEDGNGRIGRLLVEKVLSQGIGKPILIAVSNVLERGKKTYYAQLEKCNRTLEVHGWVDYFSKAILQAQNASMELLRFLIQKSKLLLSLAGRLNPRQEKVLLRMFDAGPEGFQGGLSAENYIAITRTSRPSATRDLADLVEKGALVKTGQLRHTRYWLNLL